MCHAMINALTTQDIYHPPENISAVQGKLKKESCFQIIFLSKGFRYLSPHYADFMSLVLRNVGCKLMQNVPGSDFN